MLYTYPNHYDDRNLFSTFRQRSTTCFGILWWPAPDWSLRVTLPKCVDDFGQSFNWPNVGRKSELSGTLPAGVYFMGANSLALLFIQFRMIHCQNVRMISASHSLTEFNQESRGHDMSFMEQFSGTIIHLWIRRFGNIRVIRQKLGAIHCQNVCMTSASHSLTER